MKEDGARRRAFELLIEALYLGTPQLRYRHRTGRELANDVYRRFGGHCFCCGTKLSTRKTMHLDHTRPLALLWPLDETATALCKSCNSEKRDRPPIEFYEPDKIEALADITGITVEELKDPAPNMEVVKMLLDRLDWFFSNFLLDPEMMKVRDGKVTGELLVKALQKVLEKCPGGAPVNLVKMYNKRRLLA